MWTTKTLVRLPEMCRLIRGFIGCRSENYFLMLWLKCPRNDIYIISCSLTLCMLGKSFSRRHFEILVLFFIENRI